MARKAHDLLDVFRYSDEGDDDGPERAPRGRRKRPARAPRKERAAARRKDGEAVGLKLNRRQVVLASSAVALLLVLSFVLGLSAGRGGRGAADGRESALSADTPRYYALRGAIRRLDTTTQRPVDPSQVMQVLERDYGLSARQVLLRPQGGELVIEIGPFPSEEQARAYHRDSGIEMLHLNMSDPFRWPEYVAWSAR